MNICINCRDMFGDHQLDYKDYVPCDGWEEPGDEGIPICPSCGSQLGFDGFLTEDEMKCELIKVAGLLVPDMKAESSEIETWQHFNMYNEALHNDNPEGYLVFIANCNDGDHIFLITDIGDLEYKQYLES